MLQKHKKDKAHSLFKMFLMQVIKHIVNTFDVVLSVKSCADCTKKEKKLHMNIYLKKNSRSF